MVVTYDGLIFSIMYELYNTSSAYKIGHLDVLQKRISKFEIKAKKSYICHLKTSVDLTSTLDMLFAEKIRHIRETKHILQRQLAAALEIDTAMYSRIERGDRPARREQVLVIAQMLGIDSEELLNLWLADKVYDVIRSEVNAAEILKLVQTNITEKQAHGVCK